MALTITISRGTTLPSNRPITLDDLHLLGLPTVSITGGVGPSDIAVGAVNSTHILPGSVCTASATGTSGMTVLMYPGPSTHASGTWLWMVPASTNNGAVTLTINSLSAKSLRRMDGTECRPGDVVAGKGSLITYDATGGYYVLLNPAADVQYYAVDSGTADAMAVSIPWVFSALTDVVGVPLTVRKAGANTGATTMAINGKAPVAVRSPDGSPMVAGQLAADAVLVLVYDGTYFRLLAGGTKPISGGALTPGATVTVDLNAGQWFTLNTAAVNGTETIAFSGTPVAGQSLAIAVTYGTGTTPTIAGPTGTMWVGGSAPSAGASGQNDMIVFVYTGASWWGMYRTDFKT